MPRDDFLIAFLEAYAADLLIAGPQYAIAARAIKEAAARLRALSPEVPAEQH